MWLANEFGVHATGLNIYEPQVQLATKFVRERDLEHLVDFRQGDFWRCRSPIALSTPCLTKNRNRRAFFGSGAAEGCSNRSGVVGARWWLKAC